MAFMVPDVGEATVYVVETEDGTDYVPADVCGDVPTFDDNPDPADAPPEAIRDYVRGDRVYSVERRTGWTARLSAPGYMDATHWSLFDTEAEARAHLRESYECCPWTGDTLPGPDVDDSADPCDCGDCDHDTRGGA